MELMKMLDKLNFELNDVVAIYDQNLTSPLFVGFIGEITFEYLKRTVKSVVFEPGSDTYKSEDLFYMFKVILKS